MEIDTCTNDNSEHNDNGREEVSTYEQSGKEKTINRKLPT